MKRRRPTIIREDKVEAEPVVIEAPPEIEISQETSAGLCPHCNAPRVPDPKGLHACQVCRMEPLKK